MSDTLKNIFGKASEMVGKAPEVLDHALDAVTDASIDVMERAKAHIDVEQKGIVCPNCKHKFTLAENKHD
jgi:Zn finger protein HypA/HybF involved in hydrogenase expression